MVKKHFAVTGMTCSACSSRVEKSVAKLNGVEEVAVNLLKNSMVVSFAEDVLTADEIIAAVVNAGYGASLAEKTALGKAGAIQAQAVAGSDSTDTAVQEYKQMKRRLIISLIFVVPLFYISMGHMLGAPMPSFLMGIENAIPFAFTQFLLLLPIIFVNFKFYRIGYKTLFQLSPNMDSLIAIGSSAAIVYGIYAIYKIGFAFGTGDLHTVGMFSMDLYFESAGMILTLITLGKFFESRAKGKTSDAITKLMNLAPKTAIRLNSDGTESEILADDVHLNDTLIVKAGTAVPVDGIIIEGNGTLDESALTGEPIPVDKQIDSQVIGGTINKSGYFKMRVTKVGTDTTLAQIVNLVDEATSSKAPIAKLADKVSGVFVPIVITIAVLTTIGWLIAGQSLEFALSIGICVLVISCPCALGLATPTAIMVGTGKGAGNGILLKSAEALETAHSIDTVVLDKTGTVTLGKPVVTDMVLFQQTATELLGIAASLEKLSEHPLGEAIVNEAAKQKIALLPVDEFTQIAGQGITGKINGKLYLAGNKRLLQSADLLTPELTAISDKFADEGKTPLFFATEAQIIGIIIVADIIKETSPKAVAKLQQMGIDVVMLTGDNAKTAQYICKQVGITHVISDVLPQDKEFEIRKLQESGKKVAMVGDGINDAPALARADVGIAIGAGTDIAIDSADIVLMKSDLLDVSTAVKLSKAVIKNIKENLFWAFIYNIIGIPIAMGLFYTSFGLKLNPMLGAFAMSFSSIFVVSNALRLRFFKVAHDSTQTAQQTTVTNTAEINIVSADNIKQAKQGEISMGFLDKLFHQEHKGTKKVITTRGMMCEHCVKHVTKALQAIPGVNHVDVNLMHQRATVYVEDSVTDAMLTEAIVEAGYKVVKIEQ